MKRNLETRLDPGLVRTSHNKRLFSVIRGSRLDSTAREGPSKSGLDPDQEGNLDSAEAGPEGSLDSAAGSGNCGPKSTEPWLEARSHVTPTGHGTAMH